MTDPRPARIVDQGPGAQPLPIALLPILARDWRPCCSWCGTILIEGEPSRFGMHRSCAHERDADEAEEGYLLEYRSDDECEG